MSTNTSLPTGFESLEPFVEFWAADNAGERAHCRDISSETERDEFYNALQPLVPKALDYLDSKPLSQHDESEQRLMRLILSFAHVAAAVELHREEEAKHAKFRPYMRITQAPADLPPA